MDRKVNAAIWLSLSFGLGYVVGRPSRPAPQNCLIEAKEVEPSSAPSPTPSPSPTPKTLLEILQEGGYKATPKTSPSPSPKPADESEDEKADKAPSDGTTKAEQPAAETDSYGDPVKLNDEDAKKWIKSVVNSATRYIGSYEMEGMKVTLTADKYSHLPQLRTALTAANLRVTEEAALNVGDLVYYIVIKGQ